MPRMRKLQLRAIDNRNRGVIILGTEMKGEGES
jgi:hypothetical protein